MLTLIVATGWLWSPALHFGFIYDDHLQIESNPDIHSWSGMGHALHAPLWAQLGAEKSSPYYRPLFSLALFFQYSLFGTHAELWHLTNICMHLLVVLSLFLFLLLHFHRLVPAFCGAIFFASSPLATEVVNWVSALSESLYTFLILIALCALTLCRRTTARKTILFRFVSACSVTLAIFVKETAIVGVVLVLAYELLLMSKELRRVNWLWYSPLLIPLAAYLLFHPSVHSPDARSMTKTLIAVPYVGLLALKKMALPLPVSEFYDVWIDQTHSAVSLVLHATMLIVIGVALVWCARRSRFVAWALLVVVLPLVSCLAGIYFFRDYDLFHDRYLYLSTVGIAILIAAATNKIADHNRMRSFAVAVLVVLICGEAWQSRVASEQFRSDLSLFYHAVEVAPQNIIALQLLAETELRMNDCRAAVAHYQTGEKLRADLWQTPFFLGISYLRCGMTAAAADAFSRAATTVSATKEQAALAWYEVSRARLAQGDLTDAQTAVGRAAVFDPGSRKIQALLAQILSLQRTKSNADDPKVLKPVQ